MTIRQTRLNARYEAREESRSSLLPASCIAAIDDVAGHVRILVLVYRTVLGYEYARSSSCEHILHHCLTCAVYVCLTVLAYVDVAEACGRVGHGEQRIENERIHSVVIQSALTQCRIVFGRIQHLLADIFAVVQYLPAAGQHLFVVPVHDCDLSGGIDRILSLGVQVSSLPSRNGYADMSASRSHRPTEKRFLER